MSESRVILCGDSHLSADSSHGVTKLDPRLREVGWEVENLAVGGATTRDALKHLRELPAGPTVYSFGTNDAAPWKRVAPEEFERNYMRLLRMSAGRIVVLSPSPVAEQTAQPRTNVEQRRYSDIASHLTRRVGGTFIDLFQLLVDREDALLDDGVHLTDPAYEAITQAVLAALDAE